MYEKEVVDQTAKIEKMAADGKDEYDIKKQVRLINYVVFNLLDNYMNKDSVLAYMFQQGFAFRFCFWFLSFI